MLDRDQSTRPRAKAVVLLLVLGLEGEPSNLRLQLPHQVADTGQVVKRFRQARGALVPFHLERLHPGRLVEQLPPLLRAQRQHGVHRALAHDNKLIRAETPLAQELDHILQPRAPPVDEVLALAGAKCSTSDAHLGIVDRQPAIGVVQGEDGFGHALRSPRLGAGEDDIIGATRAKGSIRLLTEHPSHGIGHVALAGAVRPDHGVNPRLEHEARLVSERLEPVQPQLLEAAHESVGAGTSSLSAVRAACSSARWRLDPDPAPTTVPSTTTATRNSCSWGGPLVPLNW